MRALGMVASLHLDTAAPACRREILSAAVMRAEMTMMGSALSVPRMARTISSPGTPGSMRSVMTTSGRCSRKSMRPSVPEKA